MTEHAALMDHIYRHQRYIYDLTRKYYLLGRDRLVRELKPAAGARIIEVGCGTARNLIMIARLYPDTELFGLDASAEMLVSARWAAERAGVASRIKFVQAYAEELSPSLYGESKPFDFVIFSYSLSMIPNWTKALRAAALALSPGGEIQAVDFGDLKGLGALGEGILRRWLALFHVAPRAELLATIGGVPQDVHALTMLAGRYAFIWKTKKEALPAILGG